MVLVGVGGEEKEVVALTTVPVSEGVPRLTVKEAVEERERVREKAGEREVEEETHIERLNDGEGVCVVEKDELPEAERITRLATLNREAVMDVVPHAEKVRRDEGDTVTEPDTERLRLGDVVPEIEPVAVRLPPMELLNEADVDVVNVTIALYERSGVEDGQSDATGVEEVLGVTVAERDGEPVEDELQVGDFERTPLRD